ncbi:MAG: Zn-ribbon domain-containing OB-fold protein [Candidatus Undinarchaeales archaeon]|jgi:hypothetical protein|nr:Zn-ribbon domain-containing OB-fold protein [Candidatus Undinarchaeales archaeon]MDP7492018.1 Zn-ribbon domain-containing OB-fold protein [Candidatus Undinarchaeales archaeon]
MAKRKERIKLPETEEGTVLFNVDPIIIKHHYEVDYIHSYAQDSPFFSGLAKKKLMGTRCTKCGYTYATPKVSCMMCGAEAEWIELPLVGRVHTWTTCYFGGQEFLKETPFNLALIEFDGADTLFMSRVIGVKEEDMRVGMKVKAQFLRNLKFKPTDVYFVPFKGDE